MVSENTAFLTIVKLLKVKFITSFLKKEGTNHENKLKFFMRNSLFSHIFLQQKKARIMKKERERKDRRKRVETAKTKNSRRHFLGIGNERKMHSKGEIDGAVGRIARSEETKEKKENRKMTREKEKSERDEGIRRNDAPSLDRRKFHRVAIGLLRKPVALSWRAYLPTRI